ncbi:MAG: hypothetical protein HQ553_15060 [Chloroflexi bacterium]|nr:hypothetical protein [Chloroflexota bacterium]
MKQTVYQVKIEGHLDTNRSQWFDGWTITQQEDGCTLLTGSVVDQPALHGLLARIRDLNLVLISAQRIEDSKGESYERASEPDICSI